MKGIKLATKHIPIVEADFSDENSYKFRLVDGNGSPAKSRKFKVEVNNLDTDYSQSKTLKENGDEFVYTPESDQPGRYEVKVHVTVFDLKKDVIYDHLSYFIPATVNVENNRYSKKETLVTVDFKQDLPRVPEKVFVEFK